MSSGEGEPAMSTLTRTQRLLVARRNPENSAYETIGELSRDEHGYTFTYRSGVRRGLPGMEELSETYRSDELFPLFEHRVISPRRADYDDYLHGLGLPPSATPFEVLARSGGRSAVDTLEITPMPEVGPVDICFLVHGIRHLSEHERLHIDQLRVGQLLDLRAGPENEFDARAVLVTFDGHRLGYVPRPLLEYVHPMMEGGVTLSVEKVNSASAGFHMRLLVRLQGLLPG